MNFFALEIILFSVIVNSLQVLTFRSELQTNLRGGANGRRSERGQRICTCGKKPTDLVKIIGGKLSRENAWPWVVPLIYYAEESAPMQFCGSSLINSQYLITAGHCATDMEKMGLDKFQAYIGTNTISNTAAMKLNFSEVKIYPNFVSKTLENDIALIKLTQPVTFSREVRPLCLKQNMTSSYVGKSGVVVGWGTVKKGGNGVDKLREVKVQVINNVECAQNYASVKTKISGHMMCAAGPGMPSKDSCQGDSGGPMQFWDPKSRTFSQIGIVSFGVGCGRSELSTHGDKDKPIQRLPERKNV